MSKLKIEIKHRWTGSILFEYEKENNTLKDTIKQAIKEGADLEGADLEGADLEGADLEGADLEGACLRGVYLRGADLEGACLRGVYLRGADLEGADLRGADLRGADLEGACLEGANLEGANLEGANLEGADLRGADLEGACLRGVYLRGADLEGAYIYVSDNEISAEEAIRNFEEKNNLKVTEYYINKNIIPTRWNAFWNYGLIICKYEVIEEKIEEMTLSQVCKELGRNIKIIKED